MNEKDHECIGAACVGFVVSTLIWMVIVGLVNKVWIQAGLQHKALKYDENNGALIWVKGDSR